MQLLWPANAKLPPKPPRNPARGPIVDYSGDSALGRRLNAGGYGRGAEHSSVLIQLADLPFANVTESTIILLYTWGYFAAPPILASIGFGYAAHNYLNVDSDEETGWKTTMTEAQARALLIREINATYDLYMSQNAPEHAIFRADTVYRDGSARPWLRITRVYPSYGLVGQYHEVLADLHNVAIVGQKIEISGSRECEMFPAFIGRQRALLPLSIEPRPSDAVPPNPDNTFLPA